MIERDLFRVVPRKEDRPGVAAFYRNRGFVPIWTSNGRPLRRAKEATDFLKQLDTEGLDPSDYPTPYFAGADPYRLAADDLILTSSVLTFARHAQSGRISLTRLSGPIDFASHILQPADVLTRIVDTTDVRATLDSFNPQPPGYKALKAALALDRGVDRSDGQPKSQRQRNAQINTIIANMERWRWLPRNLGPSYVMVNIPDYSLRVVNRGNQTWKTSVVVGAPGKSATPLFSAAMRYITVNPTWNVTSIRKKYLSALAGDPGASAPGGGDDVSRSDSTTLAHQSSRARTEAGHIRFDFPNKFLVYQRDASDPRMFERTHRMHGQSSMLVQNSERYAQVLLSIAQSDTDLTLEDIRNSRDDKERSIQLKNLILVHVTYQTAFVDEAGQLQIRPDIYGYDKEIINMLDDNNRRMADVPVEHEDISSPRPAEAASTGPLDIRTNTPGDTDDGAVNYCIQRYRSYDVPSQTYLGYDGLRHPCP